MTYTSNGKLDRTKADDGRAAQLARHAPLVRRIAAQLIARLPANVEMDDLIQAGTLGLIDAMNRYDAGGGAQFDTYASQRIRGAMLDELRALDPIPRSVRDAARKIERATHQAEQQLGRAPVEIEIAESMGVSLMEYRRMLQDAHGAQIIRYDDFDDDDNGERGASMLERRVDADVSDPLADMLQNGFREALVDSLKELPEREQLVMNLYYTRDLNLREIGLVLEVSESRVCQLHAQAIGRLRKTMRSREWLEQAA
jgi:RNA polymerase sigma factor for flagellar operon FliA